MFVAVVILATGGVSYVMVKNKQITMRRQIAKTQKEMVEHSVAITMHQSDISRELGVFNIREKLAQSGSDLQPIPNGLSEVVRPISETVVRR